ncbi:SPOR domain-containing protein [Alkalilimnicola ehrlichii]|uniref:SPOR domain-containing protein n=1 Tax=Alkalilimnicola ehrlichii TaxID=351052 RepID=UPI003BA0DAB2
MTLRTGLVAVLMVANLGLAGAILFDGRPTAGDPGPSLSQSDGVTDEAPPLALFSEPPAAATCHYRLPMPSPGAAEAMADRLRELGLRAVGGARPGSGPVWYELRLPVDTAQEAQRRRARMGSGVDGLGDPSEWSLVVTAAGGGVRLARAGEEAPLRRSQRQLAARGVATEVVPRRPPSAGLVRVYATAAEVALLPWPRSAVDCPAGAE